MGYFSNHKTLQHKYQQTRQYFEQICAPLNIEDYNLQAMPETSPAKWHLAHTNWFFETFLLKPYCTGYRVWNQHFEFLFNSYYNAIGPQFTRPKRGLLSRPGVEEVYAYRRHVDEYMMQLLSQIDHKDRSRIEERTLLGINHEQQHQELFFTDLKYSLFQNPMYPSYEPNHQQAANAEPQTLFWSEFQATETVIGMSASGKTDNNRFCYDNETPSHSVLLAPFKLANRLITNVEYLEFINDGGYQRPELWLADGWNEIQSQNLTKPLYWLNQSGDWFEYGLGGLQPLNPLQPISHVSAYESDAYAKWAGARLPTEYEWEHAANLSKPADAKIKSTFTPNAANDSDRLEQFHDHLWQWTSSAYHPYPGFKTAEGAIGEYNGKFMCNQLVLRGSSCVTPPAHSRNSYRNFFYPKDRWQFTGIRLAKS